MTYLSASEMRSFRSWSRAEYVISEVFMLYDIPVRVSCGIIMPLPAFGVCNIRGSRTKMTYFFASIMPPQRPTAQSMYVISEVLGQKYILIQDFCAHCAAHVPELLYKHCVAVAEEPVLLLDCYIVCLKYFLPVVESRHQHDKC